MSSPVLLLITCDCSPRDLTKDKDSINDKVHELYPDIRIVWISSDQTNLSVLPEWFRKLITKVPNAAYFPENAWEDYINGGGHNYCISIMDSSSGCNKDSILSWLSELRGGPILNPFITREMLVKSLQEKGQGDLAQGIYEIPEDKLKDMIDTAKNMVSKYLSLNVEPEPKNKIDQYCCSLNQPIPAKRNNRGKSPTNPVGKIEGTPRIISDPDCLEGIAGWINRGPYRRHNYKGKLRRCNVPRDDMILYQFKIGTVSMKIKYNLETQMLKLNMEDLKNKLSATFDLN